MRLNFCHLRHVVRQSSLCHPSFGQYSLSACKFTLSTRLKSDNNSARNSFSDLVVPIAVKVAHNPDDINVGEEISGRKLPKDKLTELLNTFYRRSEVRKLSETNGLDDRLFHQAFLSFRNYCTDNNVLPPELHIVLADIIFGKTHPDDLYPYFLKHARQVFPHLECMEELKKISDSRLPHTWYQEARSMDRKIIFHAGPTNSGKTYHALKRFMNSSSGVYCGPLKLLAVEVAKKTNDSGIPCDLVTGEERTFAISPNRPAAHSSCTVEMASVINTVDVAVIDEIQMLRDPGRGWAWTRALLGIPAKEIHVCGEEAAIDIVKNMMSPCYEDVEVRRYQRLSKLTVEDNPLGSLSKVQPGDCIVCFSKADIFKTMMEFDKLGIDAAVIYGSLPPETKIAQARRFNDPDSRCKVLVSTDAIGMGLNLNIRRVIFYSLMKVSQDKNGEKSQELISASSALQIGGRAGRHGSQFEGGFVTTMKDEDLPILRELFKSTIEPITTAGIFPTTEQIEMFSYHLPHATLSNLLDIFVSLCQIDSSCYFMCVIEDMKLLADLIQHVSLPLRVRYVFTCAPINTKSNYVCTQFTRFARMYSNNETITVEYLSDLIGWPLKTPRNMTQLIHYESVFDVLDLYLWLSYRFVDVFPDQDQVREMQKTLDKLIYEGVRSVTRLLKDEIRMNEEQVPKKKQKAGKKDVRLTDQLIASGLLTRDMVRTLRQEWKDAEESQGKNKTGDK